MSKFDAFGREVVGSDWNALQDVPAIISSIAGITVASGDLIIGSGASAVTPLAPGTNGYLLTMVSGAPAWAAATSTTAIGQSVAGEIVNDVSVPSSTQTTVLTNIPVVGSAVYAMLYDGDWATTGGSTWASAIIPNTGSITVMGGGLSQLISSTNSSSIYDANAAGCSGLNLFASTTQHANLRGTFSVPSAATSVSLAFTLASGSMLAKAGGLIILTRVA